MNRFRFLNVGQGLFYSGLIESDGSSNERNFRFIYDCGSLSHNSFFYLKNAIDNEFGCDDVVDIAFISHLDEDHINGLDYLNSKANIRKIILPYLFDDPVILLTYLSVIYLKDYTDKEFTIIENYFQLFTSKNNKEQFRNNCDISQWEKIDCEDNDLLFDLFTTEVSYQKWKFYLINKSLKKTVVDNIKNEIKTLVGDLEIANITNFIKASPLNIKKIKDIYTKYVKDLNITSTVIIHHPVDNIKENTMLTGDVMFDKKMIKKCEDYLQDNSIRYFLIPHHGSYKNYNLILKFKNNIDNYYVSYGLGNKYRHPDAKTVSDVHSKGKLLHSAFQSIFPYFLWNEYHI